MHTIELSVDHPDSGTQRVELGGKSESGGAGTDDQDAQLSIELSCVVLFVDRHVRLMAPDSLSGSSDPAFAGRVFDAPVHHPTGNDKRLLRALDLKLLRIRVVAPFQREASFGRLSVIRLDRDAVIAPYYLLCAFPF